MKNLDVSSISNSNGMPVKQGVWQHIQSAYKEAIGEACKAFFGNQYDATKAYILSGCNNAGTYPAYNISAGSIFFNGEVYLVDAVNFSISGGNVAIATITETFYTGSQADPVEFTDGVNRNIHSIKKMSFSSGFSGSGASDFNTMIDLKYRPQGGIGQTVEWIMPPTVIAGTLVTNQNTLLSTYFNLTTRAGIHPLTLGWSIDDMGVVALGYSTTDSDYQNIGTTVGSKTAALTAANNGPHTHPIKASDNGTANGSQQNAAWSDNENLAVGTFQSESQGSGTPFSIMQPSKIKLKITRQS